jgi:glycosyltransferase involved in cell wall biosynthesis/predicted metal-dependent phosphoesterase TrpH
MQDTLRSLPGFGLESESAPAGLRWGKVDLHIHSLASNVTDYYTANMFAIPESYSDPVATWHELKRQGMDLVTLTDHNSIDGCKAMLDAGLGDVFLSAEMTTTFPEDGCNIHVTVANMTEQQFAEVNRLRGNLYDMLDYVEREIAAEGNSPVGNKLAYWMTHPLMSTQNRPYGREGSLQLQHIEKALLLLPCLEVRNGTRTRSLNELTHRLIAGLDRETMERLANKHGLRPRGRTPWLKAMVAGSDDHSGINQGRTWTRFAAKPGSKLVPNDLVEAIRQRHVGPEGAHGGPVTLAHAMVKLIYDGSRQRSAPSAGRKVGLAGPLQTLLRFVFEADSLGLRERLRFQGGIWLQRFLDKRRKAPRRNHPFEQMLADEVRRLLGSVRFRQQLAKAERTDDRIFLVVSTLLDRMFQAYVGRIQAANSRNLVCLIKEAVALVSSNVFVSLPYLLSYLHQSSDRLLVRDVRREFSFDEPAKLVLVTDTFFEVNGVSKTIRRMMHAAQQRGVDLTVLTCLAADERATALQDPEIRTFVESGRLHILPAVVSVQMPEYAGLMIRIPPFLELLKFVQENGFTKMQISTPGTVGVAGLLAAKLLQIETSATYHTSFPEYVEDYTRDISLEALTWKYMVSFYHAVDEVVVPSRYIADLLHQRGMRNRKLLVLDRWVDAERFHPRSRSEGFWRERGMTDPSVVKYLYVGRVGREKNLDLLVKAFLGLWRQHHGVHLVIVGDGPYRKDMEQLLAGAPCTFTGFLDREALAQAFASADVKVFPSTTDTWGNAPLEAQASGLPVIVTDKGGPQELMLDGITGIRVPGRDVSALQQAMARLLDPDLRQQMGANARKFVEDNQVDLPFSAILDADGYRQRVKERRKLAAERSGRMRVVAKVEAAARDHDALDGVADYIVDHRLAVGEGAVR